MTRKLSSDLKTFREAYLEHYRGVREVLERRLPGLGEGQGRFPAAEDPVGSDRSGARAAFAAGGPPPIGVEFA